MRLREDDDSDCRDDENDYLRLVLEKNARNPMDSFQAIDPSLFCVARVVKLFWQRKII